MKTSRPLPFRTSNNPPIRTSPLFKGGSGYSPLGVTLLTPQSVANDISLTLIPINRHLFISSTLKQFHKKQENGQRLSAQEHAQLLAIATYFDSPNLTTIVYYWGIQAQKQEQGVQLSAAESVMLKLLQQYAYSTKLETLFTLSLKQEQQTLTPTEAQQLAQLLSQLPKESTC